MRSALGGPSESTGIVARRFASPRSPRPLLELAARSEFLFRRGITVSGFGEPRFAVGPCPGCAGFPRRSRRTTYSAARADPLCEFCLPLESCPTIPGRPPQRNGNSPGLFGSLQHTADAEVHDSRTRPAFASFRPQGLVTLAAACSLRALANLISCRRRSWDFTLRSFVPPRKVLAAFPPKRAHMPFSPMVLPPPKRRAGPSGRGSWVLTLPRVPSRPATGLVWMARWRLPWVLALLGSCRRDA